MKKKMFYQCGYCDEQFKSKKERNRHEKKCPYRSKSRSCYSCIFSDYHSGSTQSPCLLGGYDKIARENGVEYLQNCLAYIPTAVMSGYWGLHEEFNEPDQGKFMEESWEKFHERPKEFIIEVLYKIDNLNKKTKKKYEKLAIQFVSDHITRKTSL